MPVYCFTTIKSKKTVERVYRISKVPWRIKVDGEWAARDIAAEHAGFKDTPGAYPYFSDAMGVNPDQIKDAVEADRRAGFTTEYHPETGALKVTDRVFRKRFAESQGLYDRNGGYGDPQKRR